MRQQVAIAGVIFIGLLILSFYFTDLFVSGRWA